MTTPSTPRLVSRPIQSTPATLPPRVRQLGRRTVDKHDCHPGRPVAGSVTGHRSSCGDDEVHVVPHRRNLRACPQRLIGSGLFR